VKTRYITIGVTVRAWHLGVIIAIIGIVILLYAFTVYRSIFDPNFFNTAVLGFLIFILGMGILGIKFRQWVEHH